MLRYYCIPFVIYVNIMDIVFLLFIKQWGIFSKQEDPKFLNYIP